MFVDMDIDGLQGTKAGGLTLRCRLVGRLPLLTAQARVTSSPLARAPSSYGRIIILENLVGL